MRSQSVFISLSILVLSIERSWAFVALGALAAIPFKTQWRSSSTGNRLENGLVEIIGVKRGLSSSALASSPSEDSKVEPDYASEETLLKINFATQPNVSLEDAVSALSKQCQSFPFAAVLPVQPLHYLPTSDGGVEVKFLRKKTDLKSGIDGGIRFFLTKPENDTGDEAVDAESMEIELTAKRNSVGQSISKIMSEKLVVTAFVQALTSAEANNDEATSSGKQGTSPPIRSKLRVSSMFHKWM